VTNEIPKSPIIEMRPPQALHKSSSNARIHSTKQIRQIAKTIETVGFIGAVIVDENDVILAGEARIEAAKLREMSLGQRFDGLNHIRLLRRACRTKCG
jgi:hypothetical protein